MRLDQTRALNTCGLGASQRRMTILFLSSCVPWKRVAAWCAWPAASSGCLPVHESRHGREHLRSTCIGNEIAPAGFRVHHALGNVYPCSPEGVQPEKENDADNIVFKLHCRKWRASKLLSISTLKKSSSSAQKKIVLGHSVKTCWDVSDFPHS